MKPALLRCKRECLLPSNPFQNWMIFLMYSINFCAFYFYSCTIPLNGVINNFLKHFNVLKENTFLKISMYKCIE